MKFVKMKIYGTVILPVVLYGCETWPLTLREKHRLGVFESRVLKKIFGLQRDEVTGGRRRLCNEELHDLYSLQNVTPGVKSRRIRSAWHVARMADRGGAYSVMVGRTGGK
jgi:hypothetical protein